MQRLKATTMLLLITAMTGAARADVVVIEADAIADADAAVGSLWAVGGAITTLDDPDNNEFIFGSSGEIPFSLTRLVVTFEPIDCPEDLDGDAEIGFDDMLLSNWGPCAGCPEDLDGDGIVGFDELLAILSAWGPCP